MKKFTFLLIAVMLCTSIFSASLFSDLKKDHWAYKAIENLAGKGILEGYPDGTFQGEKTLTRYEASMIIAKLMGASVKTGLTQNDISTLEKLIVEFSDELAVIGVKVTALEDQIGTLNNDVSILKSNTGMAYNSRTGKIDITGDMRISSASRKYENDTTLPNAQWNAKDNLGTQVLRKNNMEGEYKIGLNLFADIDEDVTGFIRLRGVGILGSTDATDDALWNATQRVSFDDSRGLRALQDLDLGVEYAYIDIRNIFDLGDMRVGRQNITLGHNLVYAAPADAIKFDRIIEQISITSMMWDSNNNLYDISNTFTTQGKTFTQRHENGFDSMAINLNVDFGGHAVGLYYMQQQFESYDPYRLMGDSYAVNYGTKTNGTYMNSTSNGLPAADLAAMNMPSADPQWMGFTLDGNVTNNLDYFFEFIRYSSDLAQFTSTLASITNQNGVVVNVQLPGRGLGGDAYLLGFDWDLTDDLNLILQYGVGEEEFAPSTIDIRQRLNGMLGRFNVQSANNIANYNYYFAPTGSLQGVKDLFAKVNYDFNDKTTGYFSYENCKENDSNSLMHVVPTDGLVYNTVSANSFWAKPSEYTAVGFGVKHQYRPNTALTLDYTNLQYDQDVLDPDGIANNNKERNINLAPNAGGWQMIRASVEVKF